jgi:2-aminoethylphosphonate-pyruvate transaminase
MTPILLTPGPLTTRDETRHAMLRDWGSRDSDFIALTADVRRRLLAVANAADSHVAVPLQGSGTFIVEATIGTLVGPDDKLLVLVNGAYGERIVKIAQRLGRAVDTLVWEEVDPIDPGRVARALDADLSITHVAVIHCETTTGLLNPLAEIAAVVAASGRKLLVDAMSSFGALPIDLSTMPATAVMASSNKCLEGTPGLGYALIEKQALAASKGNSPSLSFDLYEQWQGFESNGQWRFTPPVQVLAALGEALRLLEAEGGPAGRLARYRENCDILIEGMARLGFPLLLDRTLQAPIIATFRHPHAGFDFEGFYQALAARGFVIYPGKLSKAESFRIGCIGAIDASDFRRLLAAIEDIRENRSAA